MLSLSDSVSILPGVGPARKTQLENLGISTVADLLYHIPFRYEQIPQRSLIADVKEDEKVCVCGTVVSKTPVRLRFKRMIKVRIQDESGVMDLTWFNADYILTALHTGDSYYFFGKVSLFNKKPTLTNPTFQSEIPQFGKLSPIYHESATLHSKYIRKLVEHVLMEVECPDQEGMTPIYTKHHIISLKDSFTFIHTPPALSLEQLDKLYQQARYRLAFDEMFFLMKQILARKEEHRQSKTVAKLAATNDDIKAFYRLLPYEPTTTQKEAIQAISLDLVQSYPMDRLVQGEVGSGKTTVAAFALWVAAKNGHKAVLVCPTNILASQHYQTLQRLFNNTSISLGLFTGKEKNLVADVLVGTHALFNLKGVKPALVIIDEEHRFGVNQRDTFFAAAKKPHFLSMTATPIPRTVALTALADKDVSFIVPHKSNENIKTWVVPPTKRKGAYEWIAKKIDESGGQAMIVCPFIEESDVDTLATVKSAKKEFEQLASIFPHHRLALLHGKMKPAEKDTLFADMMEGKYDILVTTPVVEVGVDLPKANVILIEGAERFGLAQLHQLRGRVGRRGQDAFCLLFTSPENPDLMDTLFSFEPTDSEDTQKRLGFFAKTYDGNKLAEYDLKQRGSGELLGVRQHGFDSLRFASWFDTALIDICKKELEN